MIFGANLGENLMIAASDKWLFYITVDYKYKNESSNKKYKHRNISSVF